MTRMWLWDAPHKMLFLASALWALVTIAWWPLGVGAGLPPPAFEPVILWHIHELFFGFAGAAVGAYLLTALPGWASQPPVGGTALKVLVLWWGMARVLTAFADLIPLHILLIANAGYFLWLAGIIGLQTASAGAYSKIGFSLFLILLGFAEALFMNFAMTGQPSIGQNAVPAVLIGFSLLICIVGSRAIPAFTRNWLAQSANADQQVRAAPLSRFLAQLLLVIALVSTLLGWPEVTHIAMICAGLAILKNMQGWRSATALADPLLAALHVAYLWLPIGLVGIGLLWFSKVHYSEADAIHALTIGAMSGLIIAIAGRATSHQKDGDMRANKGFVAGVLLIWSATWVRLSVPIFAGLTSELLIAAALLWCLGWLVFLWGFLPLLLRPATRPVLSGKRYMMSDNLPPQPKRRV